MRIQFRDFIFDSDRRELTRQGSIVHLSPRAFELLDFLLERRPEAVRKEELYDRLWPETFVQQANLNNVISELRRALNDNLFEIIRTKQRFGYSFASDAVELTVERARPPDLIFRLTVGELTWILPPGPSIVGRDVSAAVSIDSPVISRRHARFVISGEVATIEDLGSKNGTFIGRDAVVGVTRLQDGDAIQFGSVMAHFHIDDRDDATLTDRSRR